MVAPRTWLSVLACASWLACLVAAPSATAAAADVTAPTLKSPAAQGGSVAEGSSIQFEWTGVLQGDEAALDRSFFRLELIATANMPAGVQATWESLENFAQTDPGTTATSYTLGVPPAGDYRWRVCVWGVVDMEAENAIQQLPGGCSASRQFSSVAAATTQATPGELKIEQREQVAGPTREVFVPNPNAPKGDSAEDAADDEAPAVDDVEGEAPAATFQDVGDTTLESQGRSALNGVDAAIGDVDDAEEGLEAASSSSRTSGSVVGALGSTVPFLPIPFWTLALLMACAPILRLWRRDVFDMFEWSDGSIDGHGTLPDVLLDLEDVPVAQAVKHDSHPADDRRNAPARPAGHRAPEGGRHAA